MLVLFHASSNAVTVSLTGFCIFQLLCLARAVLKKSKVVIIDEVMSILNANTEKILRNVLRTAFSDRTVINLSVSNSVLERLGHGRISFVATFLVFPQEAQSQVFLIGVGLWNASDQVCNHTKFGVWISGERFPLILGIFLCIL